MIGTFLSLLFVVSSGISLSFLIPQSRNQDSLVDMVIMRSNKDRPHNFEGKSQELIRRESRKKLFFHDLIYSRGISKRDGAKKLVQGVVNIRDFGAVGDGRTDDTKAIQAALNSKSKSIVIPSGNYVVSKTLVSNQDDRSIYGSGSLTANTRLELLIKITGFRNKISLNVKGNRQISGAILVAAGAAEITDCIINNLYSAPGKSIAIKANLTGQKEGVLISNNIIKKVTALGDGVKGNGVGMSRGIVVAADRNMSKEIVISNNQIESILGEEGDAIVVRNNGYGSIYKAPISLYNNKIYNFTRRGIKMKASGSKIANNYFENSWRDDLPSLNAVIDVVKGDNHYITGNILVNCRFLSQIKVHSEGEVLNNFVVTKNYINGIGRETKRKNIIYLKTLGTGVVVKSNTIDCPEFSGSAIKVIADKRGLRVKSNNINVLGKSVSIVIRSAYKFKS